MTIPAAAPAAAPVVPDVAAPAAVVPAVPAAPAAAAAIGETPAPVVPAAPAEAPVPAAGAFEPSGDAGLDLAANWITSLGIPKDDPAIQAALEEGNFDFIKAKLATMGDKARGWEQYIALAEKGMTSLRTAAEAQVAATNALVYEAVGGEEAWGKIAEWAGANAEPAEKEGINAMLAAGGIQARAAASYLQGLYSGANGVVVEPTAATVPTAKAAPVTNAALSAREYSDAVRQLANKIGGGNLNGSPEYAALQQRRLAYRG